MNETNEVTQKSISIGKGLSSQSRDKFVKIGLWFADNFYTTTAQLVAAIPIYSIVDLVGGLVSKQSLYNRGLGSVMGYAGIGKFFQWTRNQYHKIRKVEEGKTSLKNIAKYDTQWMLTMSGVFSTLMYFGSGAVSGTETSLQGAIQYGSIGALTGLVSGQIIERAMDLYDYIVYQKNESRVTDLVKNRTKTMRYALGTGLMVLALSSPLEIYSAKPNEYFPKEGKTEAPLNVNRDRFVPYLTKEENLEELLQAA